MKTKSMDVLREKLARHPRREIEGRSWNGTPCLELMVIGGTRPVMLKPDGYGVVDDGQGAMAYAHRAALAIETGRDYWTEPLVCDHRCFTRNCCNTLHLEWITDLENKSVERHSPEGLEAKRISGRTNGHLGGRIGGPRGGRVHVEATRIPVISRHLDTEELRWHRDMHAAARELGVRCSHIPECVRGKRHRTGRYTFERYDEENDAHINIYLAQEW